MNKVADIVVRQLVATGVARLPWKKIRAAVAETALIVAYEQGRKVGRREGFDGATLAAAATPCRHDAASQAALLAALEQGLPSHPQQ